MNKPATTHKGNRSFSAFLFGMKVYSFGFREPASLVRMLYERNAIVKRGRTVVANHDDREFCSIIHRERCFR